MMFQILAYIKFLITSTNQHGVHSPFVYDLITKCFYDTSDYSDYQTLISYRESLLTNESKIEIKDFGSGSRIFKSNVRSISRIARTSGSTVKRTRLLYRIARYFKPDTSLELGTSLGISTLALSLGHQNNHIISIEGCGQISKVAESHLNDFKRKNIKIITSEFDSILPTLKDQNFDLIFFDGNHNKNATLHYFEMMIDTAHNDSVFIFDDIYWSKDMTEAWTSIKANPKVTMTIDTFYWGFVFFRKEQQKQNFKIRL